MTRQTYRYTLTETRTGRIVAKFSLLSEASTAADALAVAYNEVLEVQDAKYPGYVYRTAR
jgi:hypothetical protein